MHTHSHNHAHDFTFKVEKGKDYNITIKVIVPYLEYNSVFEGVLSELSANVKIAGFRPGKAPKAKIVEAVGSQAANHALDHLLPEIAENILVKENLNPITQIEYGVEGLSVEEGLKFTINFVLYPEIKLGNLEKLKVKLPEESAKVTDAEILSVVGKLFDKKESEEVKWLDISDEMAASLKLDGVTNVEELKAKVSDRLSSSKTVEAQRKFEEEVLDAAIAASTLPIPGKVLDERIEGMVNEYKSKIAELNVNLEDFLKAQNLTEEKLKEQKKAEAEKSIKQELLLNEIARKYELIPEAAEVDAEIASITDENTRAQLQTSSGRRFVLATLLQQRSFNKLLDLVKASQKK